MKKLMQCVILLVLPYLIVGTAFGRKIKVPKHYITIQAGIDAATNGDIVEVADGTYTGEGNRDLDFGGKAITVRSQNGPENCIIDGEATQSYPGLGFYFHNGEDENSVVDGFTITRFFCIAILAENTSPTIKNCIFSDNGADACDHPGPAIFNSGSITTVTNCTFIRNSPKGDGYPGGGAIYNTGGLTITGSTFTRNFSDSGGGAIRNTGTLNVSDCAFSNNSISWHIADGIAGGAICNSGSLTVTNSTFYENYGDMNGGGAISNYSYPSSPASATITNCAFYDNGGYGEGGAITHGFFDNFDSSMIIVNCIFSGNTARFGGAVYSNEPNTSTIITNCTFTGNFASEEEEVSGGAIDASNTTITNSIIWDNRSFDGSQIVGDSSTVVTYSDIEGGYPGIGNIDADPLFVDSGYWDNNGTPAILWDDFFVVGDFHLTADSPCVDAGTKEAPEIPKYDFEGDPRKKNSYPDIGADEFKKKKKN